VHVSHLDVDGADGLSELGQVELDDEKVDQDGFCATNHALPRVGRGGLTWT
jgi:hypothetical protein